MNLFFVHPEDLLQSDSFTLRDQEAHHAARVLRMSIGDEIHLSNGMGLYLKGVINSITRAEVMGEVVYRATKPAEQPERVLALGFIRKRDRLEFAIEKAVELGVSKILIFHSDHSEKAPLKLKRLELIAQSAMKQSLRFYLPEIQVLDGLSEVLEADNFDSIVIAHEKAGEENILDELPNSGKILLLIGPEGGFSEKEIEQAGEAGASVISLGNHRLRAETAAVALLSRFI